MLLVIFSKEFVVRCSQLVSRPTRGILLRGLLPLLALQLMIVATARAAPEQERVNIGTDLVHNAVAVATRSSTAGLLIGLGLTPTLVDDETNRAYRPWTKQLGTDHVFEFGNVLGNGVVHSAASVGLYTAGKLFHRPGLAELGSDLFSSQLITGFLCTGLKVATSRTRPDGTPYSFPSGHSSVAFATAGVISFKYGLKAGLAAEAVAGYVALSRLQENKHYISDVVAGGVLGNYVAYVVTRRAKVSTTVSVEPMVSGGHFGLRFTKKF